MERSDLEQWKAREVAPAAGTRKDRAALLSDREDAAYLRVSVQSMRNWDGDTEQEALITIEDVSGIPTPALASHADAAFDPAAYQHRIRSSP